MLALTIDLLAGRYHATPWGRAANEGEAEWPPSPWRIGRALASAWWRTPPDERPSEVIVDSLLAALAPPPRFVLPRATAGHTRHYMPKPNDDRTLVLDPFVRTDGSPLIIVWDDLELGGDERDAFAELLPTIGYVGRAESPCILHLSDLRTSGGIGVAPLGKAADDDGEIIRVLCLTDDASIAALSESTAERRRRRLVAPPCGRFVSYVRPRDALEPPYPRRPRPQGRTVIALRFALEGAAVPPVTEALRLAERYRAAALKRADRKPPQVIARLRGRSAETGDALVGHAHAHYLPTDEDGDGRLDHLTVWCPAGIGADELDALDFTTLTSWAFDHPLGLVLLETIEAGREGDGPVAISQTWRSHTPFLPTRHPKRRSGRTVDGYADQVVLELERRGLPRPLRVRPVRAERRPWSAFRRERGQREHRPDLPVLGFEIEFAEPVRGPIALGRNSHFGMGLFLPAD